ncbi:unnamed protein product [Urochloa humidicola]
MFTADGDMRQALNNLQATFGNAVNHIPCMSNMVKNVLDGKFEARSALKQLYDLGYSPTDIVTTLFCVVKNYGMAEYLKLEMLKETGFARMRICDSFSFLAYCQSTLSLQSCRLADDSSSLCRAVLT